MAGIIKTVWIQESCKVSSSGRRSPSTPWCSVEWSGRAVISHIGHCGSRIFRKMPSFLPAVLCVVEIGSYLGQKVRPSVMSLNRLIRTVSMAVGTAKMGAVPWIMEMWRLGMNRLAVRC